MKETIEREKARLQAVFDHPNRYGSWMRMTERGQEPLDFGLIDSYQVTRVALDFSAEGDIKRTTFWLLFRSAGYDLGFQYAHTVKVVEWSQPDTFLVDFVDDLGRRYHVEGLVPPQEPEYVADWSRWQAYRAENSERFAEIDAALLKEHLRIAEEWEAVR